MWGGGIENSFNLLVSDGLFVVVDVLFVVEEDEAASAIARNSSSSSFKRLAHKPTFG